MQGKGQSKTPNLEKKEQPDTLGGIERLEGGPEPGNFSYGGRKGNGGKTSSQE